MENTGKKSNSILGAIIGIVGVIGVIVVVLIALLSFYLETTSRYFDAKGEVYQFEQVITDENGNEQKGFLFVEFTEDGLLNTIATDEYFTLINKMTYEYKIHAWDHIGDFYFKTDSVLSFTSFEEDALPVTIEMECIQSRGWCTTPFDDNRSFVTYENVDDIGYYRKTEAWFYEDGLMLDGITLTKVDEIDPVCMEAIRLFIDNDENFNEYFVEE